MSVSPTGLEMALGRVCICLIVVTKDLVKYLKHGTMKSWS